MRQDYSAYAELIRNRISADTLGRDLGLRVGRDGRCRCVFCSGDRDDTLKLYPEDRGYYCFRCHERGDVISLYQRLTGCGFRDAVKGLNEQYGLDLPLDGGDRQAMEKARKEAEKRRREREAEMEQKRKLQEEYLDVAEEVWRMEQELKEKAPKNPDALWDPDFRSALSRLDELRYRRDWLFDQTHSM